MAVVRGGARRGAHIWPVVVAAGTGRTRCRGPLGGHDRQTGRVDSVMMCSTRHIRLATGTPRWAAPALPRCHISPQNSDREGGTSPQKPTTTVNCIRDDGEWYSLAVTAAHRRAGSVSRWHEATVSHCLNTHHTLKSLQLVAVFRVRPSHSALWYFCQSSYLFTYLLMVVLSSRTAGF